MWHGLFLGNLFKYGYDGLLAQIEKGADGDSIKPYVRLYTKSEVKSLLEKSHFEVADVSVFQYYWTHFAFFGFFVPPILNKFLDRRFGWYVASKARKPVA
jgi:hypothetical protein